MGMSRPFLLIESTDSMIIGFIEHPLEVCYCNSQYYCEVFLVRIAVASEIQVLDHVSIVEIRQFLSFSWNSQWYS